MTNKELFMFSNRNKGGGTPQPSLPDVPYSDWVTLAELPSGTTAIPANAFNGFSNLRNVVINDGLTTINSYAFYDCTSLKEIDVPRTVSVIGEKALGYSTDGKITDFTICGDYETAAETYAIENNFLFIYNNGVYTYTLNNGKAWLQTWAGDATDVYVPSNIGGYSVRYMNQDIFASTSITQLIVKHNLASLYSASSSTAMFPSSLKQLTLPNTIAYMDFPNSLLQNCNRLSEIILETDFKYPLICRNCPLTQQSLVGMLNALADLTGQQAKTLTLGNTNLAKLNNEQIAIATEKNWTLA